jgi:rubrerythrin
MMTKAYGNGQDSRAAATRVERLRSAAPPPTARQGVGVPVKQDDIGTQLREAFGREAESVLRCLFYVRRADVEGRADIAGVLRTIADGEISQAFGHLELVEDAGDAIAGGGDMAGDLTAVIDAEGVAVARYTELTEAARGADHTDAADWFETFVEAESVHLGVLRRAAAVGG